MLGFFCAWRVVLLNHAHEVTDASAWVSWAEVESMYRAWAAAGYRNAAVQRTGL